MKKSTRSIWSVFMGIAVAAVMFLGVTGCEGDATDDESDVRVTNLDNHDYVVRLRRASDDGLIDEKTIEEGESRDFDGVAEGRYYVTIARLSGDIVDRSGTFTVEDDEDVSFTINGDGDIR